LWLSGVFFLALCSLLPQLALAGPYYNSAHGDGANGGVNGVDRSGSEPLYGNYDPGSCAHCHEQHASLDGSEPLPQGGLPDKYLLFDDALSGNDFCAVCHGSADGNPPTGDVASAADYTASATYVSGHDPGSTVLPVGSEPLCVVCHDVHAATSTSHSEAVDGNTASGVLLKVVAGNTYTWGSPGTPSGDLESLSDAIPSSTTSPITKEYELCFKCHAFGSGSPPGTWTDQGEEFNPNNYSVHPVAGPVQWNNSVIRNNPTSFLKTPWSTNLNKKMHCSDCHGSGVTGDPVGPHGSNNKYLLKDWGAVADASAVYAPDRLCLRCHVDTYDGGSLPAGSPWSHASNGAHQYEGEDYVAGDNVLGCYACHGGPAGFAAFSLPTHPASSNGGRAGGIHGSNFMWKYPGGTKKAPTVEESPAWHFLTGGYNTGMCLGAIGSSGDQSDAGTGTCWSNGGVPGWGDPCGSMSGGQGW